jgi:hypothetical protein
MKQVVKRASVSCLAYSQNLMIEVIYSSENSVEFEWATRRCISDTRTLTIVVKSTECFREYFYLKTCKTDHNKLALGFCKELIITIEPILNLFL